MGIYDVDATRLIHGVAEELKKEPFMKPPSWAAFVKTGISRERAPVQEDWWFIRASAILRKLFILGPVGTIKLRTQFGSRKNNGVAPEHFEPGAGNHIRKILQQLEKSGFAKQAQKGVHKGRIITPKGQRLLEVTANGIMKKEGIVLPVKSKEDVKVEAEQVEKKTVVKKARAPRKKKVEETAPAVVENVQQ